MAFVGDDDKLQDPNQQQQGQGQAQQTSDANPMQTSGGEGSDVTGGSNASGSSAQAQAPSQSAGAQAGSGGMGGWTNIQSYMQANQGDNGSAKNLQDTVGNQFTQEKSALDTQANDAKTAAKGQADQEASADSNASKWVQDAAKNYDYSGNQAQPYQDGINQVKSALSAQYTAPTSYNFGLSDQTQQLGQNLTDDNAFNQYMGDLYQQKAGGQLSQGGRALQNQLDVGNQALSDTRQNLLQDYAGLGTYRDQTVADANTTAQQAQQDFYNHQANLKNYLQGESSKDDVDLTNAEQTAKTGYANTLNSTDGRKDYSDPSSGFDLGTIGGNKNWSDLTKYFNDPSQLGYSQAQLADPNFRNTLSVNPGSMVSEQQVYDGYKNANQQLNRFYSDQDEKYANTGDDQKREWNAIQDMLGTGAAKKDSGFKVRG